MHRSAFLEEPVSKGAVGDALVRLKAKRAEKKAKPKKVNFALRPLKGMSVMMGVAKSACECEVCEKKELKCSECPKCSRVAKGAYSESMEGIQRDRQKANRRRSAGNAFLGGAALAGTAALANPVGTMAVTERAGDSIGRGGASLARRGGAAAAYEAGPRPFGGTKMLWSAGGKEATRTAHAGRKVMDAGFAIARHPGRAAAGIVGGAALAGAGLKGAGMAHNARSNKNARKYNKKKANSRIKIVPTSGKNRF